MRIAVDAMGTDSRPVVDVAGGVLAANEFGDTIVLVGDQPSIESELKKLDVSAGKVEILNAPHDIAMDEKPTDVLKSKASSSILVALDAVKAGDVDAFVTMGNTGAVHAIATLKTLRRIHGVKRPVLSALFPINDHRMIFLDVGANTDVKAEWVTQFAVMGSIYAQRVLGYPQPRIALLSNGAEDTKGQPAHSRSCGYTDTKQTELRRQCRTRSTYGFGRGCHRNGWFRWKHRAQNV